LLLEFELEFELELELEFELELLLWFELELELWFELEFELWFELELRLWFELEFEIWLDRRLMVRRLRTARPRHHSIRLPSIFRSARTVTVTTRAGADGGLGEVRAALRSTGAWVACSSWDWAESGPAADPTAKPSAPTAPA
jgi:hypothetical protein